MGFGGLGVILNTFSNGQIIILLWLCPTIWKVHIWRLFKVFPGFSMVHSFLVIIYTFNLSIQLLPFYTY